MCKFECIYLPGSSVDVVISGTDVEDVGSGTDVEVRWSIPTLQNNLFLFCYESRNKGNSKISYFYC